MMKISIVTLYDLDNYGNRLQNYALTHFLKVQKFKVNCLYILNNAHKKVHIRLLLFPLLKDMRRTAASKNKLFYHFTKYYIGHNHFFFHRIFNGDSIIIGSDQVWNPSMNGEIFFFQKFAPQKKKLAYAASFGVSALPEGTKKEYAQYLSEMKAISVREESGAKIVKELIGKDVPVLIDPTLLLDKSDWQKVSKKPHFHIPEKYLLTYYLGEVSEERNQYLKQIASENGLEIIRLEAHTPTEAWWKTGPSEFLWLIEHCSLMCTDSFHGSVFSILMEVPFIVFNRDDTLEDMSSRIDTLLTKFQLEGHRYNHQQGEAVFNKDYSHVNGILEIERAKSIKYLEEGLDL